MEAQEPGRRVRCFEEKSAQMVVVRQGEAKNAAELADVRHSQRWPQASTQGLARRRPRGKRGAARGTEARVRGAARHGTASSASRARRARGRPRRRGALAASAPRAPCATFESPAPPRPAVPTAHASRSRGRPRLSYTSRSLKLKRQYLPWTLSASSLGRLSSRCHQPAIRQSLALPLVVLRDCLRLALRCNASRSTVQSKVRVECVRRSWAFETQGMNASRAADGWTSCAPQLLDARSVRVGR